MRLPARWPRALRNALGQRGRFGRRLGRQVHPRLAARAARPGPPHLRRASENHARARRRAPTGTKARHRAAVTPVAAAMRRPARHAAPAWSLPATALAAPRRQRPIAPARPPPAARAWMAAGLAAMAPRASLAAARRRRWDAPWARWRAGATTSRKNRLRARARGADHRRPATTGRPPARAGSRQAPPRPTPSRDRGARPMPPAKRPSQQKPLRRLWPRIPHLAGLRPFKADGDVKICEDVLSGSGLP